MAVAERLAERLAQELPLLRQAFPDEVQFSQSVNTRKHGVPRRVPLVIDAMAAGAYQLDGWVSTIPLDDVVDHGFKVLRDGEAVKILVDPSK